MKGDGMTGKLLFRGDFIWNGELFTFHRYAYTSDDSFILMIAGMAKQIGKSFRAVRDSFLDGGNQYHIQRVIPKRKRRKRKKKTSSWQQLTLF
jgi:hypothetical protein